MNARVMKVRDVMDALGVSRVTLWRLVKAGKFPQPIRIGSRILRWRVEDVEAWLTAVSA